MVHRTHLGKPRPSLLTLAVKGPMYVARRAGVLPQTAVTVDARTATGSDFPGTAWAVWHALTARDRVRAYRGPAGSPIGAGSSSQTAGHCRRSS